ncbi:hypothetical protein LNJ06_13315, partial [Tenacibaculum finnmarkense genomovar ulcerans]|uniref:hypothetical protein n=1 Tax=Tenacibaculum finnmarkense TaxID=2781243 RepID=UPI001E6068D5
NKIYNLLLVRTYLRKSLGDFLFRFYLLNLVLQKCNKPYIKRYMQFPTFYENKYPKPRDRK